MTMFMFKWLLIFFQTFKPLIDNAGLWKVKNNKPIEYLTDLKLDFQDYAKLKPMRVRNMPQDDSSWYAPAS